MTSIDSQAETQQYGFDCPNCGDTTVVEGDNPSAIVNNIYECGGCGEKVLMRNYMEAKGDE